MAGRRSRPARHFRCAGSELRVEQCLERVVEYVRYFARCSAQAVRDPSISRRRDGESDGYLALGDERVERVDVW